MRERRCQAWISSPSMWARSIPRYRISCSAWWCSRSASGCSRAFCCPPQAHPGGARGAHHGPHARGRSRTRGGGGGARARYEAELAGARHEAARIRQQAKEEGTAAIAAARAEGIRERTRSSPPVPRTSPRRARRPMPSCAPTSTSWPPSSPAASSARHCRPRPSAERTRDHAPGGLTSPGACSPCRQGCARLSPRACSSRHRGGLRAEWDRRSSWVDGDPGPPCAFAVPGDRILESPRAPGSAPQSRQSQRARS